MGVQEDGFYYSYYPNGQVESKGFIENGLNQGVYTRYYEDGTLQRIIDSYGDGKKWGYEEWFYPSGKIEGRREYKNDELHGLSKSFNKKE